MKVAMMVAYRPEMLRAKLKQDHRENSRLKTCGTCQLRAEAVALGISRLTHWCVSHGGKGRIVLVHLIISLGDHLGQNGRDWYGTPVSAMAGLNHVLSVLWGLKKRVAGYW
jgi:hypothetical protein